MSVSVAPPSVGVGGAWAPSAIFIGGKLRPPTEDALPKRAQLLSLFAAAKPGRAKNPDRIGTNGDDNLSDWRNRIAFSRITVQGVDCLIFDVAFALREPLAVKYHRHTKIAYFNIWPPFARSKPAV